MQALALSLRAQTAKRYALCIDDPFYFACALFALFACGKEPVIPANAAPGYLADLSNAYDVALTAADTPRHHVPPASEYPIDPQAPLTLYPSPTTAPPPPLHTTPPHFTPASH